MALRALDTNKTVIVESDYDPDKGTPKATKFYISPISAPVMEALRSKHQVMTYDPNKPDEPAQIRFSGAGNIDIVKYGLKKVENFLGLDDMPVEVKFKDESPAKGKRPYKVVTDEFLELLHDKVIIELAQKIQNLTPVMTLPEEKVKVVESDVLE